ncbi:unnamed protein product [Arctogadus glacialis]
MPRWAMNSLARNYRMEDRSTAFPSAPLLNGVIPLPFVCNSQICFPLSTVWPRVQARPSPNCEAHTPNCLKTADLVHLTKEQALADLAFFISYVQREQMFGVDEETPWFTKCPAAIASLSDYVDKVLALNNSLSREMKEDFSADRLADDEFRFFFSDIFVEQVQYGGRTALCQMLG